MQEVFIVIESGGSYEDAWESNRFVVLTEDAAKACIAEQAVIREKKVAELAALAKIFEEYKANQGQTPHKARHDIPRWPAGIPMNMITPEMREERNRLQALNREIEAENQAAHRKYYDDLLVLQQNYAREHGLTVPASVVFTDNIEKTTWHYDRMPVTILV